MQPKITTIRKSIDAQDRYPLFLKLIASVMPITLSDQEIKILDLIHMLGGEINSVVRQKIRDSITIRNKGGEEIPMSEYNLNNYIAKLKAKKLITNNRLHRLLDIEVPESELFLIQFEVHIKK